MIDRKEYFIRRSERRVDSLVSKAPQARKSGLACYGATAAGSSPKALLAAAVAAPTPAPPPGCPKSRSFEAQSAFCNAPGGVELADGVLFG